MLKHTSIAVFGRQVRDTVTRALGFFAVILVAALTTASPAQAEDWTTLQKVSYTATLVGNVIDWGQTRTIAKNPHKYREMNKFLGDHPSTGRVNGYFMTTTLIYAALPHLSDTYREKIMHWAALGITLNITRNHFEVGLKMSF